MLTRRTNIFGESLDEVPSFGEARAALEDDFVAGQGRDDSKRFGDVIVLLDDAGPKSPVAEVIRRLKNRLLEIWMLKKFHVRSFAYH